MPSSYIGRWLFTSDHLEPGYLRIEDGSVAEVCSGDAPSDSGHTLVLPSFVNAHTHIGDSVAYPAPAGSLDEIVAPPSGYKHRILRSASRSAKIDAMRRAMTLMTRTGTSDFIDFREEGIEGVMALKEAVSSESARPTILGRPASTEFVPEEIDALIGSCSGVAMSAVRDWDYSMLSSLSERAKAAGKRFSVHASEAVREDIDKVLNLKPDFVVHMTKATQSDLERCANAGVAIVVCPRSNQFFGLMPHLGMLKKAGIELALGTDNGMVSRPDMMEEMKAAYRLSHGPGGFEPAEIISLATAGGRKVLNAEAKITTEIDAKSDLTVVRIRGDDPLLEVVTETSWRDIHAVVSGGRVRRSETWRT